jgi:hypothetical protein
MAVGVIFCTRFLLLWSLAGVVLRCIYRPVAVVMFASWLRAFFNPRQGFALSRGGM